MCSEFCGLHHAYMTFTVTVVRPDAFRDWLAEAPNADEVAS